MSKLTQEELKKIVEDHHKWLKGEEKGKRANLSGADFHRADLHRANLPGAILSGANLSGANLYLADLHRANLSGAYLYRADLSGANLSGAILSGAHLNRAELSGAILSGAILSGANLSGADLYLADLSGADLYLADLSGAKNITYIPMTCPDSGAFIGWKKVFTPYQPYIIKLQIPASAKRSSATGRKCRCEFAKVLKIENLDGSTAEIDEVKNNNYAGAVYKVGETVKPDSYDENRYNECSNGIHFFINRQEAVDYQ